MENIAIFAVLIVPLLFFYALIGKCVSKNSTPESITEKIDSAAAVNDSSSGGNDVTGTEQVISDSEEIDLLAVKDDKTIEREEKEKAERDKLPVIYRIFPFLTFVLVLASCLFSLSAYFPGILAYDSEWQTLQACDLLPLSNHHPLLHTLIWNAFLALEWAGLPHPYALVLYCIFQMTVVSAVCAYVVKREIRSGCRWYYELLTALFYTLYPAFSVFSAEMTKDVLFSCMVVLLILKILKAGRGERVNSFSLFLITTLACLLRNNFLPAGAVLAIALLFIGKSEKMTKHFFAVLLALVLSAVIMLVVYPACGVMSGESREALSVPINQVSAVYTGRYSELTIAEKFIIENYMEAGMYNPRLADTVKFTFDSSLYDSDRSAFWDLYMHLFLRFPEEFVNAFLTQNIQMWYPGARITDRYSGREYLETENVYIMSYETVRSPLLPEGYTFYQEVINYIENAGVVDGLFFSLSIPFFSIMLAFYIACKIHKRAYTAAVFTTAALWGTYLLGPVSSFRYMYTFFILIPVILMPVFSGRIKINK